MSAETVKAGPAQRRSLIDTLLSAWGVLALCFLFLPVFVIVAYSFNTGRSMLSWQGSGSPASPTPPATPRSRTPW